MTCEICEIIRDCECASAREKPEEQPEEPAGTIVEYGMWEGLYHPNHNPEFAPIGQARPFKQEGWGQRQEWEE